MRWKSLDRLKRDPLAAVPGIALILVLLPIGFSGPSGNSATLPPTISLPRNAEQQPKDQATPDLATENLSAEQMRNKIRHLTEEIDRLRRKNAELERKLHSGAMRDRLTKAEDRVGHLQNELIALDEKISPLQSHIDEVNEQLRPDNINQIQILGSTRPEAVREATVRRLNSELTRAHSQMELLTQSRTRLQSSLSETEMLIVNLRAQLQSSVQP
jgi:predicted  nucleic acid-binding Zn-ribbon protein